VISCWEPERLISQSQGHDREAGALSEPIGWGMEKSLFRTSARKGCVQWMYTHFLSYKRTLFLHFHSICTCFYPEDEGRRALQSICNYLHEYMLSQPRTSWLKIYDLFAAFLISFAVEHFIFIIFLEYTHSLSIPL
jgi:hypothetical protein